MEKHFSILTKRTVTSCVVFLSGAVSFKKRKEHHLCPSNVGEPLALVSLLVRSRFGRCLRNNCRFLSGTRPLHVFYESRAPDTIPELGNPMNTGQGRHFGHSVRVR